jgi:non-ribosomal peptide synthase protein (TIGR01720 family)
MSQPLGTGLPRSGEQLRELLVRVYAEALERPSVDADRSLRDLGGDSVLAMSIMWRLEEIFPTLAGDPEVLAEVARLASPSQLADRVASRLANHAGGDPAPPAPATMPAEVGLLPDQAWFLEEAVETLRRPETWGAAWAYRLPPRWRATHLVAALEEVCARHPALGAGFRRTRQGWRQHLAASAPPILIAPGDGDQVPALRTLVNRLLARFDLGAPLAGFGVVTDREDRVATALLLVAHHLACDLISTGIIQQEIEHAYEKHAAGGGAEPAADPGYPRYIDEVDRLATAAAAGPDLRYWWERPWEQVMKLPRDGPAPDLNTVGSREVVRSTVELPAASLRPEARWDGATAVTAAVGAALSHWCQGPVTMKLTHHGRDLAPAGRTSAHRSVGRFATSGLFFLPPDPIGHASRYVDLAYQAVQAVPQAGVGYSLLRWIGAPDRLRAREQQASWRNEVLINYFGAAPRSTSRLTPLPVHLSPREDPDNLRFTLIDVSVQVRPQQLALTWSYSDNTHRRETVEALADHAQRTLTEFYHRHE